MKFSGSVGFWLGDVKVKPGVYQPNIIERPYAGDVLANRRRFQPAENTTNEDLFLSNQISVLSDLFMQDNWPSIRYVVWKGTAWKVTNVEINYPRLTLDLGGVYNGQRPPVS